MKKELASFFFIIDFVNNKIKTKKDKLNKFKQELEEYRKKLSKVRKVKEQDLALIDVLEFEKRKLERLISFIDAPLKIHKENIELEKKAKKDLTYIINELKGKIYELEDDISYLEHKEKNKPVDFSKVIF